MVTINKSYMIAPGTAKTIGHILVVHATADYEATAANLASYEHRTWRSAETFVHLAVDDKGAFQVAPTGYVAWGAGNVNRLAPVQIELCQFRDRVRALKAYNNLIALAVAQAKLYGVPLTLDSTDKTNGIKSHYWCSRTYGGSDHTDPYAYLQSIGISKAQLAADLKAGHASVTATATATVLKPTVPVKTTAAKATTTKLAVDGDWGASTTKRLQVIYKTTADGIVSSQYPWACFKGAVTGFKYEKVNPAGSLLIAAIQRSLGLKDDGLLGPATIRAMQRKAGTPVDGVISVHSQLVMYIQRELNAGRKPF
ncbi:peptidoglycan recognition family protein [Lacticaseibacillus kribbianus]|uniref:peptidoglycan recognition protein family protein n=1 Tax=Lacticaseibacillus kribbianus TaxID=2926292 RepID=UPI001CD27E84|nr:peptidoglycan recognition family protein [Lacticaseibacillus kribbianus]